LIGKTPLSLFDPNHSPPCFATAGDTITFDPIDSKTFLRIENEVHKGFFKIKPRV